MSLRPQEPHKENGYRDQRQAKNSRPQPRKLRCSAFFCFTIIITHTNPPSAVYLPVTAYSLAKGGITPLLSPALLELYDVEIQDQANEDGIHQQPGKNDTVSKIFFTQQVHSACLIWRCTCKACGYAPATRPLPHRTGLHSRAASMATC